MNATSTIWFGKKYKGQTVDFVLRTNPSYILWALENIQGVIFTPDVLIRAKDSQIPLFSFNVGELNRHLEILKKNNSGSGTAQYFIKMAEFLLTELRTKNSILIRNETQP